jgi:hypothetical protein
MKKNYLKGFDGIHEKLEHLTELLEKCDSKLYEVFCKFEIDLFHFCFRWIFCLLLREFPICMAIKLIDMYICEEDDPSDLCVYICLVLLLKYSSQLRKMDKDHAMVFLQKLPTEEWGEQDMEILLAEALSLRNVFK